MKYRTHILLGAGLLMLNGCSDTLSRLENVGKPPPMTEFESPTQRPEYKPVSWPMPVQEAPPRRNPNSLWQPGAKAFFKDQRARAVGDILTVMIEIKDKAELDNQTQRSRDANESLGAPDVFGLQGKMVGWLPGKANTESLLDITGASQNTGQGTINREEKINTSVAATVTQILPNGNLVISGKQEIRVNFEVREIGIEGVVRPEDVASDNTIKLEQVAEARVTYGGRGQITDVQQPRYGQQVIDILSPF